MNLLDEFGHAERLAKAQFTMGPAANTLANLQHHLEMFEEWSIDSRLTEAEQEVAQQAGIIIKQAIQRLKQ